MATPAQRTNTWTLDEWYAQDVAGTTGGYQAYVTGELWGWGDNELGGLGQNTDVGGWSGSPLQIPGTTWVDIMGGSGSNGYKEMGGLKSDGTLWMWGGWNNGGNLGQNDRNNYSSPVQIPGTNWKIRSDEDNGTNMYKYNQASSGVSWAIKSDGTLWAWGYGSYGQTAQNDTVHRSSPTQVGTDTTWKYLSHANNGGAQFIKTDGTLWTVGRGQYGRLGLNNTVNVSSPTQIGTDTNWAGVNGGSDQWFGLKTDGTLWGTGNNNWGQIGVNNTTSIYSSPIQVGTDTNWAVAESSSDCTVAIKTDGTMWSWGRNQAGSLGQNNSTNDAGISSPTQIGTGTDWQNIQSVEGDGYIAQKTNGTLWSWGTNEEGELGHNNQTDYSSPRQVGTSTDWSVKLSGYKKGSYAIRNAS